jgi:hypothetical protein
VFMQFAGQPFILSTRSQRRVREVDKESQDSGHCIAFGCSNWTFPVRDRDDRTMPILRSLVSSCEIN